MASQILTIPREMRDKIYHHLLIENQLHRSLNIDATCPIPYEPETENESQAADTSGKAPVMSEKNRKTERKKQGPVPVAILRSCHQVYDEASKILYEKTPFYFKIPQDSLLILPSPEVPQMPNSHMLWKTLGRISYLKLDMLAAPIGPQAGNRDSGYPEYSKLHPDELVLFMHFLAANALGLKHLVMILEMEWHIINKSSRLAATMGAIEHLFPKLINKMKALKRFEIEMPNDPEKTLSATGTRWVKNLAAQGGWTYEWIEGDHKEAERPDPMLLGKHYHDGGWIMMR